MDDLTLAKLTSRLMIEQTRLDIVDVIINRESELVMEKRQPNKKFSKPKVRKCSYQ